MRSSALFKYFCIVLIFVCCVLLLTLAFNKTSNPPKVYAASPIQHVFIIMEENHNWSQIKGSSSAPYINKTLLPMGGHAEQYYNPPGMHPSEPNYLWLEAGTNFGITNDNNPSANNISSTAHLVTLLKNAGISWKAYEEDIPGTNCPISNIGNYAVRHAPFVFFNDVSGKPPSSTNSYCQSHYIPFTKLSSDLASNSVASYNFITPNLQDDMHDGTIQQADSWLSNTVPMIMNSQAYKNNGLIIITWDEGEGGDGPIGMIVLSPLAKKNYSNTIHYDHSSTLRTMEEIFGVSPMLGGAARATDLSDFFTTSITSGGTPQPTGISPTFACLGSCPSTPSPTIFVSGSPTGPAPTVSGTPSGSPSVTPPCTNGVQTASVHSFKVHKHKKGALSNFILLIIQFLIKLLEQLLGIHIHKPHPGPHPSPSTAPGVSPTAVPSTNPCPSGPATSASPTTSVSVSPTP